MSRFILRRLLLAIPTLFGVLVLAFLLLYVAPGDPVTAMIGERADSATISRLRRGLRLDDPLYVRVRHHVGQIPPGNPRPSHIPDPLLPPDPRERFPQTHPPA